MYVIAIVPCRVDVIVFSQFYINLRRLNIKTSEQIYNNYIGSHKAAVA